MWCLFKCLCSITSNFHFKVIGLHEFLSPLRPLPFNECSAGTGNAEMLVTVNKSTRCNKNKFQGRDAQLGEPQSTTPAYTREHG